MTIASTPWRVAPTTEYDAYGSFNVRANGGRLVAVVWSGASSKTIVADMVVMAEANARLIAAAPDLRDELRTLIQRAEAHGLRAPDAQAALDRAGG